MTTGLTVTVNGQQVPLDDCGWFQRRPCGCIVSMLVAVSGSRVVATAQQAHEHLNRTKRERNAAEREGITVATTGLMTMTHYRTALGHQLAAERREMADLAAALDQAPLIPTQHGHDQHALDTCQAIWNADDTREEKP